MSRCRTRWGSTNFEKALLQSRFQMQPLEEHLKDDHAIEGRKLLILETKLRELVKTGQNSLFAALHLRCPPEGGSILSQSTTSIPYLQRRRK